MVILSIVLAVGSILIGVLAILRYVRVKRMRTKAVPDTGLQRDKEWRRAECAELRRLIDASPDDAVIDRISLEDRLEEVSRGLN